MLKKVIVGLDGSKYAKSTISAACQLAKDSDGVVVGVGVVDLPGIESIERGGTPGALYFAEKAEEHKLKDAIEKVEGFLTQFESTCKKYGVNYELHSKQGVPFEVIVSEGKVSDLIILGLRTFFHFETRSKSGDTLRQVLENAVCPVFAVPEKFNDPQNILIAYDGSVHSARALRAFTDRFYPSYHHIKWIVLTLSDDSENCKDIQQEALNYLRCWGIEAKGLVLEGSPARVIHNQAESLEPMIAIIGAYGRSRISEIFFGSTTRRLIEDGEIPLAIYH